MVKLERLFLETTNRCNFNCSYCPREWLREQKDMEWRLFVALVDTAPKSVKWVHLNGFGEPLMDAQFEFAIMYVKEAGKKVKFYTNGSLWTPDRTEAIALAEPDIVVFSIDETWGLKQGEQMYRRTKELTKRFKTLQERGTEVIVRATRTPENEERMDKIREFWLIHADKFGVTNLFSPFTPDLSEKWAVWPKPRKTFLCENLQTQLVVRADGTVPLCCQDWFSHFPLTDLSTIKVRLWQDAGINVLDWIFKHKNLGKVRNTLRSGYKCPAICVDCPNNGGSRVWRFQT